MHNTKWEGEGMREVMKMVESGELRTLPCWGVWSWIGAVGGDVTDGIFCFCTTGKVNVPIDSIHKFDEEGVMAAYKKIMSGKVSCKMWCSLLVVWK